MSKGFLYLGVMVALVGCGKPELRDWKETAEEFKRQAAGHGVEVKISNLDINTGELPEGIHAKCDRKVIGANSITINSNTWEVLKKSPSDIESILFHEMGHCVLGRSHLDTKTDGRPISLMCSSNVSGSDYQYYKEEYLNELFSKN
jgi:hypothetical protein